MFTRIPLRAVIFDWDGTLLDSYRADARAYLRMFEALGIPWGLADLAQHYSPDWHNVYRAAGLPPERWEEADGYWRRFYRSEQPALLPGARIVLERLSHRYPLGLVSSGSGWRVRVQLARFGLLHLFAVRVYGDEIPRRKPHSAQLQIALRKLGVEPAASVYVGDTAEDMMMARRAGVFGVGVMGATPAAARLRAGHPGVVIPNIAALPRWLRC